MHDHAMVCKQRASPSNLQQMEGGREGCGAGGLLLFCARACLRSRRPPSPAIGTLHVHVDHRCPPYSLTPPHSGTSTSPGWSDRCWRSTARCRSTVTHWCKRARQSQPPPHPAAPRPLHAAAPPPVLASALLPKRVLAAHSGCSCCRTSCCRRPSLLTCTQAGLTRRRQRPRPRVRGGRGGQSRSQARRSSTSWRSCTPTWETDTRARRVPQPPARALV